MSTFQPPTKQAIREISAGLSSFCTEQKSASTSTSPNKSSMNPTTNRPRKIVRARRGSQKQQQQKVNGNQSSNNNMNNNDIKFSSMNDSEYISYQKQTEQHRMKRKRKFDVFSSGSNESLHELLQRPKTFRVAYHSMFYVRVDNQNNSQLKQTQIPNINTNMNKNINNNNSNSNNKNNTKNAFEMMTKASKAINDWKGIEAKLNVDIDDDGDNEMKMDDNDNNEQSVVQQVIRANNGSNIFYPIREECLITRSVRVSSEWVTAFEQYEIANNIAWKEFNSDGKIHEYQINRNSGLMLLNLDDTINKTGNEMIQFLNENEKDIKQWVIDHGFSGFICNSCFYLFQPHLFWNLLDDNKRSKVKQTLISDMFQSTKTKPANNAWKAWKATF